MKTFVKLCISIIRKNKGFTAGILIMSVLSVAIAFLGANFGPSSEDTIMRFLSESGTPDAIYVTEPLPENILEAIKEIGGVRHVSPGFLYDTNIETENGSLFSVRVFRTESDPIFINTVHEEAAYDGPDPQAAISSEFAEYNQIRAGDRIRMDTPIGKKDVVVSSVISNPQTMECSKDEMSSYESYQFAYLYICDCDFDRLFPVKGLSNQWMVYFDEDLSLSEQKERMREIREILGTQIVSETFTDESDALNSIRDDLHTISVLCSFIPGVIWLISLGFNFIFIRIIVENQRKTIGLLRAIGFSIRRVILVFVAYTVLINFPALLLGIFAGYRLLCFCLGLIAEAEGILSTSVIILPGITAAMVLMVFVIGITASFLSAGTISKVDPAEAYSGREKASFDPPGFFRRLQTDAFFKISLVSLVRNYKRQIIGALCITACIISMCIGFEGVLTIGHPINAVYGERYRYDLMVRNIQGNDAERIRNEVSGLTAAEPTACFSAEMLGKNVRVSTISEDAELTVLSDASGNQLFPGDGVIIDEMSAKISGLSIGDSVELGGTLLPVTGIAREILYMVIYVSPQTGALMGYDEPNCILLKLNGEAKVSDVQLQIEDICKNAYFVKFSSQKENIRDAFVAMRTIMLSFAILAFCIGSLLILNISVIDFNENRIRYATLRALGTPVRRLGRIAVIQNLFRVALGILLALPLCRVCVSVLLELLSGATQQYVMVKYTQCLILSCLIPLLYVLLGTVLSLYKIKRMEFCSYLNEVE